MSAHGGGIASLTIRGLAAELAAGRTTSRALTERALARIEDAGGEGARAFVRIDREAALAMADAADRLRAAGQVPSPLAGVPISIKDLFDVAGQRTLAGSKALDDRPPAAADAPAVARLRAAGAVFLGRTNMTEFAYSGLGVNPHFGTPGNPFDRDRVPGGSSSGAAVSVADGMAAMGLGTDTGGSVRIPSAFCGLTGFKPTQARVPLDGAVPLSYSLDSIGPLANSVDCCAIADAILAGEPVRDLASPPVGTLRFVVPTTLLLDGLDDGVAAAFRRALDRLSAAGATIEERAIPTLAEYPAINAQGGLAGAEAWHWHRRLIERRGGDYDPRVRARIERGAGIDAADYIDLMRARAAMRAAVSAVTARYDAALLPTVACYPPRFGDLAEDDEYVRLNLLCLRNCSVGNFLDRCAATLPCHADGELPAGLMVMGESLADRRTLDVAAAVEGVLGVP